MGQQHLEHSNKLAMPGVVWPGGRGWWPETRWESRQNPETAAAFTRAAGLQAGWSMARNKSDVEEEEGEEEEEEEEH